jgi:hypothetical protein
MLVKTNRYMKMHGETIKIVRQMIAYPDSAKGFSQTHFY